jgi:hypothetical protein
VPTGGVNLLVKRRGGERGWAATRLVWAPGWPSWAGALLFSFFLCYFFSYFLFYDLFYNSNIWIPNAFKQVSKFL